MKKVKSKTYVCARCGRKHTEPDGRLVPDRWGLTSIDSDELICDRCYDQLFHSKK